MISVITCPACQTRLRLPEESSATSFTCPRCLGEVPRPGTEPAAGISPTPSPTPSSPRTDSRCPYCDAALDSSRWRYCPECSAPLGEKRRGRRDALDDDVARDRQRTGWFTITLLILGILALIVMGLGSLGGGPAGLALFLFVIAVLTGCVWGVVYVRTRDKPEDFSAGRVARGVVATVGAFVFGYFALALVVLGFLVTMFVMGG